MSSAAGAEAGPPFERLRFFGKRCSHVAAGVPACLQDEGLNPAGTEACRYPTSTITPFSEDLRAARAILWAAMPSSHVIGEGRF